LSLGVILDGDVLRGGYGCVRTHDVLLGTACLWVPLATTVRLKGGLRCSVAHGSMFRGWGSEVDGHENAMLNQYRETASGETDADEIE